MIYNLPLADWHSVGLELGISDNALKVIQKNNVGDANAQKREMFSTWLRQDVKATYRKLMDVLMATHVAERDSAMLLAQRLGVNLDSLYPSQPATKPASVSVSKPQPTAQLQAPTAQLQPPTAQLQASTAQLQASKDEEGMGHLLDPEDVDALFEVVKSAKAKWRDIGRELGFTLKEMDNIVAKKGISQDQDYFQELLDLWLNWAPPKKSFPCTEDLLEALRHIGQHRLALKLEQCDDFMRKKGLIKRKTIHPEDGQATPPVVPTPPPPVVPTTPPPNVKTTPTTTTLSTECTSTTTVTAQVVGNGNTSVTIQSNVGAVITKMVGDDYCMVSSDGGSPNPAYKMASNPHGIALIISNMKFDKQPYRAGGEVDERKLLELFGILKYQVVFLKNLKGGQIDMALRLVSGHNGFSYIQLGKNDKTALEALSPADNLIAASHDSFVCCIMSHGDDGVVYGTDGKRFDLQHIYHYLGECEHLKGKPKMIFIQACQGSATAEHNHVEDDGCAKKTADFLLSYAAFYGQKSFREKENGTWYMSALCNTFKENYKSKDVVSMITDVHKEVMDQKAEDAQGKGCLQCPRLEHSLRHKVHLAVKDGWFQIW